MTPQARSREFPTPRYAATGSVETRGAVWRPERIAWDGGDTAAGEIMFEVSDDAPSTAEPRRDHTPDPFESPTLRLR